MKRKFLWAEECKNVDLWLQTISIAVDQEVASGNKNAERMEKLSWLIQAARDDYRTKAQINYTTIFHIGRLYGRFIDGLEADVDSMDLYKLHVAELRRTLPLRQKQLAQKHLKEVCQNEAQQLWAKPELEHLRLGEMCQEVWSSIYKWLDDAERDFKAAAQRGEEDCMETVALFRDVLPEQAEGLKTWLREIAPESATRKGRPSKK